MALGFNWKETFFFSFVSFPSNQRCSVPLCVCLCFFENGIEVSLFPLLYVHLFLYNCLTCMQTEMNWNVVNFDFRLRDFEEKKAWSVPN